MAYLIGNNYKMDSVKLLTFPRSGSHFLRDMLLQKTGFDLRGTHKKNDKADFIITIVRNPLDAFISTIKMDEHYRGTKDGPVRRKDGMLIMKEYVEFHEEMYQRANLVIDYNDLINKPLETVAGVAAALGLEVNDKEYVSTLKDRPEIRYLVSSTKVHIEPDHCVYTYDLTKPLEAYNKVLQKKLKV